MKAIVGIKRVENVEYIFFSKKREEERKGGKFENID